MQRIDSSDLAAVAGGVLGTGPVYRDAYSKFLDKACPRWLPMHWGLPCIERNRAAAEAAGTAAAHAAGEPPLVNE